VTRLWRFSKYGIVAVGSAATDWVVFTALMMAGTGHIPAQMTSRIAGGVFSFTANKWWCFVSHDVGRVVIEGRRFLLFYAFSYTLAVTLMYLFTDILDLWPYFSKLLTDTTCFLVNFVVMQTYVFKDRDGFSRWMANGLEKVRGSRQPNAGPAQDFGKSVADEHGELDLARRGQRIGGGQIVVDEAGMAHDEGSVDGARQHAGQQATVKSVAREIIDPGEAAVDTEPGVPGQTPQRQAG